MSNTSGMDKSLLVSWLISENPPTCRYADLDCDVTAVAQAHHFLVIGDKMGKVLGFSLETLEWTRLTMVMSSPIRKIAMTSETSCIIVANEKIEKVKLGNKKTNFIHSYSAHFIDVQPEAMMIVEADELKVMKVEGGAVAFKFPLSGGIVSAGHVESDKKWYAIIKGSDGSQTVLKNGQQVAGRIGGYQWLGFLPTAKELAVIDVSGAVTRFGVSGTQDLLYSFDGFKPVSASCIGGRIVMEAVDRLVTFTGNVILDIEMHGHPSNPALFRSDRAAIFSVEGVLQLEVDGQITPVCGKAVETICRTKSKLVCMSGTSNFAFDLAVPELPCGFVDFVQFDDLGEARVVAWEDDLLVLWSEEGTQVRTAEGRILCAPERVAPVFFGTISEGKIIVLATKEAVHFITPPEVKTVPVKALDGRLFPGDVLAVITADRIAFLHIPDGVDAAPAISLKSDERAFFAADDVMVTGGPEGIRYWGGGLQKTQILDFSETPAPRGGLGKKKIQEMDSLFQFERTTPIPEGHDLLQQMLVGAARKAEEQGAIQVDSSHSRRSLLT